MRKYTKEEIEELKKKPVEELTPYERRLTNLSIIQPGEVRNPNGLKKGTVLWPTRFKKLLANPDFLKRVMGTTPENWRDVVNEDSADVIAAGLIASVLRQVQECEENNKRLPKETLDAIALINKMAFGDKIVHETDDSFFQKASITFNVVPDREQRPKDKE